MQVLFTVLIWLALMVATAVGLEFIIEYILGVQL